MGKTGNTHKDYWDIFNNKNGHTVSFLLDKPFLWTRSASVLRENTECKERNDFFLFILCGLQTSSKSNELIVAFDVNPFSLAPSLFFQTSVLFFELHKAFQTLLQSWLGFEETEKIVEFI